MNVDQKPTRFSADGGPSLCVVATNNLTPTLNLTQGGNLMMAWRGLNSHDLWWSAYPFTSQSALPSPTLGSPPSMCVASVGAPQTGTCITQLAWIANDSTTILSASASATSSTMESWSTPEPLAPLPVQPKSDAPVALTTNYDGICAFWKGATSNELWWGSPNSSGVNQATIPGAKNVFTGPGAAVQDGVNQWLPTWVFWADEVGTFWGTMSTNGYSWSTPQSGPGTPSLLEPAVAYFQGQIVLMWANGAGAINYAVANLTDSGGFQWSPEGTLETQSGEPLTGASPALAVWNDTLYVAWSGYNDNRLWYAAYSEIPYPAS